MPDRVPHVAAVVLAAGASTRLGAAKQLVEFRGVPLVRRAAEAAIAADANPVIVVLGARATEVAGALLDLAGVHLELNERWRDGLASSLVAGVSAATRLDACCDGVLIIAADQPLVDDVALRLLMDAFRAGARLVAAGYSGTIGCLRSWVASTSSRCRNSAEMPARGVGFGREAMSCGACRCQARQWTLTVPRISRG